MHEFAAALPAVTWLKARGFQVGFNLMQVADRGAEEIKALARQASEWPLDVLYFADSMGSMNPDDVAEVIGWFRAYWHGPMGIHTHDNMSLALANTLRARPKASSGWMRRLPAWGAGRVTPRPNTWCSS